MNIEAKTIKIQFTTYTVRLVRHTAYLDFCSGRMLKSLGLGLKGPGLGLEG